MRMKTTISFYGKGNEVVFRCMRAMCMNVFFSLMKIVAVKG
jgi:hypothetical protein